MSSFFYEASIILVFLCISGFIIFARMTLIRINQLQQSNEHATSQLREFLLSQILNEQLNNNQRIQQSMQESFQNWQQQLSQNLQLQQTSSKQQLDDLTKLMQTNLQEIRYNLDNSIANSMQKSQNTQSDIIKRLSLIDAAQKRISELSSNIVSLQDILSDKQARGVFGEVQLTAIVKNILPSDSFKLQSTLSNGKRADCVIDLPEPTGKLVVDAKFPLESYKMLQDSTLDPNTLASLLKQFKKDIRKHIHDIANKYIIPNETADCAIMFVPAESVFSEIHARHSDLVQESFTAKVWIVSPTTMMAILNTASAILKDLARQKEIGLIQNHLNLLAKDFGRFNNRMDNLSRHIRQAHEDVADVNASAKKITRRFSDIENVELGAASPQFKHEKSDPLDSLV